MQNSCSVFVLLNGFIIMLIISCNVDPLTSHVYKVKLGLQGYNITVFLNFARKHRSLQHRALVPTFYVLSKNKKNS